MEEGSCCSRRDGGEANSLLFHLSLSFSLSLSANLKARQAARPPTPLPQCKLFSAPLLSLFNHYRAIQSPGALAEGQYVIRPCKHSLTPASSFESVSVLLLATHPSANANYSDPPSTTFWFRPMSAASLFFCNPASASRCRHPHPDGNVTLWHRIHEKKRRRRRRNSAHSSCLCLCGRRHVE